MAKNANRNGLTRREESSSPETLTSLGPAEFDPDHPISPGYKVDRLGFRSVAGMLASSLLTQATSHGLVVSIEGVWGSGKSSLVNFLEHELKNEQEDSPQIVRFEPWLVGDRDGMLIELMSDLASAIEAIETPEAGRSEELKKETRILGRKLRGYGSTLSRQFAPIARLAGLAGTPGADVAAKMLAIISEVLAPSNPGRPVSEVKGELAESLSKLSRRIVVIVDDLDRLEPREAGEITRLIRAVANFPNVVYILCYDPTILASNLKKTLSVDDGAAFLEKIVQVAFKVPRPEPFDLRRWLLDECITFYDSTSKETLLNDARERLQWVCDVEGELLITPRDVVRAVNAIKLYWPPISEKVDYADLVWLQMIKVKSGALYEWIELYIAEYMVLWEGGAVGDTRKEKMAAELKKHLTDDNGGARSLWALGRLLPGVRSDNKVTDKDLLFNREHEAEMSSRERDRRLGSPQHSRYYFAFSKPAGALDDAELSSFISSAQDGEDMEHICLALIEAKRPQGGTKFDLLLDRLNRMDEAGLPNAAVPAILMGLANSMDRAALEGGVGQLGVTWSWVAAKRLCKKLAEKVSGTDRRRVIHDVFSSGKAIGWLMAELVRGEIWAHGRVGDRPVPEDERLLSDKELNEAICLLLHRFRSAERDRLVNTPDLLSLMYGWMEAGDEEGVLKWVREQQTTDAGFLALLSACRGWMQADKVYHPLNRGDLKKFLDFDNALERLRRISEDFSGAEDKRALAKKLLEAAKIGRDH